MRNHTAKARHGVQRATADPVDDSTEARFGRKVQLMPNGCWAYGGDLTRYHVFKMPRLNGAPGRGTPAHRFAYETLVGSIPDGCEIHHTCLNPGCVNPAHLQPLTSVDHKAEHRRLSAVIA